MLNECHMPFFVEKERMLFHQLHQQQSPLLICNVWDVASAQMAAQHGFQAIGTSSAAMAKMLGYQDGEKLAFAELVYLVKRIASGTTLPLTVDLESGYNRDPLKIIQNILVLAELGVVGINIEDSIVDKERQLCDSSIFADTLAILKNGLSKDGVNLFLNVRTDTFLLASPHLMEETLERVSLYEKAGADGIFVPGIEREEDIRMVAACTSLPLNVMCMPNLPHFHKLQKIGVKRISMGNFLFEKMFVQLGQALQSVKNQASFSPLFSC